MERLLTMDIYELCKKIELQPEITEKVLYYYKEINFNILYPYFTELYNRQTWNEGLDNIKNNIGEDPDYYKILTCMLTCVLETNKIYIEKGISDEIYVATMKYFTRFINEHMVSFGTYRFTWYWWVPRLISCNEFRIGELEYETVDNNGCKSISIHIPSDAVLNAVNLRKSYLDARKFFSEYYPEYKDVDMFCDSWLLSPALKKLLSEDSNIIRFQKSFTIENVVYDNNSFMYWVYKRDDIPWEKLPENTSLQRRMKEYILDGGKIGVAFGKLVCDPFCN